jgi:hypothetical protein
MKSWKKRTAVVAHTDRFNERGSNPQELDRIGILENN